MRLSGSLNDKSYFNIKRIIWNKFLLVWRWKREQLLVLLAKTISKKKLLFIHCFSVLVFVVSEVSCSCRFLTLESTTKNTKILLLRINFIHLILWIKTSIGRWKVKYCGLCLSNTHGYRILTESPLCNVFICIMTAVLGPFLLVWVLGPLMKNINRETLRIKM